MLKGKCRVGQTTPGTPNKSEAAYMLVLDARVAAGEIERWWFERYTLTLSYSRPGVKGQRYTPDFAVQLLDGELEFHELKGFRDFLNMNKLKMAAELFPHTFRLVTRRLKRDCGGFDVVLY